MKKKPDSSSIDPIAAAFEATIKHYKCLQKEDYYLERDPSDRYIAIKWRNSMDRYANYRVYHRIAVFLRKRLPDIPIYSSLGRLNI